MIKYALLLIFFPPGADDIAVPLGRDYDQSLISLPTLSETDQ